MSFLLLIFLVSNPSFAQYFAEKANAYNLVHSYPTIDYGGGVSFVDFNNDGIDDITLCSNGGTPYFRSWNGEELIEYQFFTSFDEIKQITWVDYDNDSDKDLFVTSKSSEYRLYQNDGSLNFTDVTLSAGFTLNQYNTWGNSWGDVNNDGWLDVYIAHYEYGLTTNELYVSNGDGTFTEKAVEYGISNSFNPTFSGCFFDYNNDGWIDLYVTNDSDNKNFLYKNVNGYFIDVSAETSTNVAILAMSNSPGDFNNDGFADIFVSGDESSHVLLKSNGAEDFSEIADTAGINVANLCWGALWLDYDYDSDLDLYVSSDPGTDGDYNFLFRNEGDLSFTDVSSTEGIQVTASQSGGAAIGDINSDGAIDILALNQSPYNTYLFEGSLNGNHYLKVNLKGVISNRDAIGSRIVSYHDSILQTRYVICGEGFVSQNSFTQFIGFGQDTIADSLFVYWPSGFIDEFFDVELDQNLSIEEGESLKNKVLLDSAYQKCPTSILELYPGEWEAYEWSTGSQDSILNVFTPGTYSVELTDVSGLKVNFEFVVTNYPPTDYEIIVNDASCYNSNDGTIQISSVIDSLFSYSILNNAFIGDSLWTDLEPNIYFLEMVNIFGCKASENITIDQPNEIILSNFESDDVTCFGLSDGSASASFTGGEGDLFVNWGDLDNDALSAGTYAVFCYDDLGCFLEHEFEIYQPSPLAWEVETFPELENESLGSISIDLSGGTEPYTLYLDDELANSPIEDLTNGEYNILAIDFNDCQIDTTVVVDFVNGIADLNEKIIQVYPNPFSETLTVISNRPEIHYWILTDTQGKTIIKLNKTGETQNIQLSKINRGSYILLGVTREEEIIWNEVVIKK